MFPNLPNLGNVGGSGESGSDPQQYQGAVYQMLWDCRFCGTTKLLGIDHRHCPNCGAAQDPQWRYFPSEEDKQLVTDPKYTYAGRDKYCPYCNTPNSAAANFCINCGGDLSGGKEVGLKKSVIAGSAEDTGKREDLVLKKFQEQQAQIKAAKAGSGGIPRWVILLIIAIVAIGAGIFFLSQRKTETPMQVADLTWERTITVEQLTAIRGSDWRDQMPLDTYNTSCRQEQRAFTRTERVQTGVRRVDRGDGSFIEQPVYEDRQVTEYRMDTRCDYFVNRWRVIDTLRNRGGPSDPLTWPEFTTRGSGSTPGDLRGTRNEYFVVLFRDIEDKGQEWKYEPPDEATWRKFSVGQRYTVDINTFGVVFWDSLKLVS